MSKYINLNTDDLIKYINDDNINFIFANTDTVAKVVQEGEKYTIKINSGLSNDLKTYFILHELSHIKNSKIDFKKGTNTLFFEFEYEQADMSAIKLYKTLGLDVAEIRDSKLFERKMVNDEFKKEVG